MLQIGADESLPAAKKRRVNAKAKLSAALAGEAPTAKPARKSSNVKTRCDFMLVDADGGKTFVEVKSVTLAEDSASPRYKVDHSSMHAGRLLRVCCRGSAYARERGCRVRAAHQC